MSASHTNVKHWLAQLTVEPCWHARILSYMILIHDEKDQYLQMLIMLTKITQNLYNLDG